MVFFPHELYHRFVWPTMEGSIATHIHQLVMYITMIKVAVTLTPRKKHCSAPLDSRSSSKHSHSKLKSQMLKKDRGKTSYQVVVKLAFSMFVCRSSITLFSPHVSVTCTFTRFLAQGTDGIAPFRNAPQCYIARCLRTEGTILQYIQYTVVCDIF